MVLKATQIRTHLYHPIPLGSLLTGSGNGVGRLGPVEEIQEGGDGDIELWEVLELFENHLQGTELLMTNAGL